MCHTPLYLNSPESEFNSFVRRRDDFRKRKGQTDCVKRNNEVFVCSFFLFMFSRYGTDATVAFKVSWQELR